MCLIFVIADHRQNIFNSKIFPNYGMYVFYMHTILLSVTCLAELPENVNKIIYIWLNLFLGFVIDTL